MDVKYEKELYELDPDFFSEAIACINGVLDEKTTCMFWGCECGDGWYEPLKKFITKVKEINDLAKMYNSVFVCEQLKEKYGELTVYYTVKKYDPEKDFCDVEKTNALEKIFSDCLEQAERDCWNICENCGSKDNIVTTQGYIQRICQKCFDKRRQ